MTVALSPSAMTVGVVTVLFVLVVLVVGGGGGSVAVAVNNPRFESTF